MNKKISKLIVALMIVPFLLSISLHSVKANVAVSIALYGSAVDTINQNSSTRSSDTTESDLAHAVLKIDENKFNKALGDELFDYYVTILDYKLYMGKKTKEKVVFEYPTKGKGLTYEQKEYLDVKVKNANYEIEGNSLTKTKQDIKGDDKKTEDKKEEPASFWDKFKDDLFFNIMMVLITGVMVAILVLFLLSL